MNFEFSDEQALQRQVLRESLPKICTPEYARMCDEERNPPKEAFDALAAAGWVGLGIPEEYGGQGGDQVNIAILLEETGKVMVDLGLWLFRVITYGGQAVLDSGTDEQKERFLPRVATGDLCVCFALTESESGSDAASLKTRARRTDDGYVINGQKLYCSGLPVSDYVLLAARTDPDAPKHEGISMFLVETDASGLTWSKLDMLGHRSVPTTAVFFDDVRVAPAALLGKENGGWPLLTKYLEWERLCLSAVRTGGASAALAEALDWAKQRHQFGRPIGKFQAVSHMLAEMAMLVDISQMLVYRYAWKLAGGSNDSKDAAIVKLYTAEAYKRVADLGLQVMGGHGYSMESVMQRHYRDARLGTIGGGTSEIQKNIIARELGL
jgi:alkylation response protein AidB-like acyl-CoA dehydrogenase